jgi:hypothetical protein
VYTASISLVGALGSTLVARSHRANARAAMVRREIFLDRS